MDPDCMKALRDAKALFDDGILNPDEYERSLAVCNYFMMYNMMHAMCRACYYCCCRVIVPTTF